MSIQGNIHARAANNDSNEIADRQIEAWLAIAFELHTANLIAALQPVPIIGGKEWRPTEETLATIRTEIDARLYPNGAES